MTPYITESEVEELALGYFASLGYEVRYGPDIADDGVTPERESYKEVILPGRLRTGLARLNPELPAAVLDEAYRRVVRIDTPDLVENNHRFHRLLTEGVVVEVQPGADGLRHRTVRLIDWDEPDNNDWLAVNQFTVLEHKQRRPDVVVFVNGLPLAVIELKNPQDEKADALAAYNQLQTYKHDIPSLFAYNEVLAVSDGVAALAGALTSSFEWFKAWKTIDGTEYAPREFPQLKTLLLGMFERQRFLKLIRYFTVFNDDGSKVVKKLAGYHQFHAVLKAVDSTVAATAAGGSRKAGVIWHTQGSGKSLSMAFFAGLVAQHPAMRNPTLVVLTDRNDLDDQLYGTFSQCSELLRQEPKQAESRQHLRELLKVASGGVIFTTMQKFAPDETGSEHPLLSERENILFIADEAHRSHYGFAKKAVARGQEVVIAAGFAQHLRDALPNASFIGFTGTPVEKEDRSTTNVFGDVIDTYNILQAVEDGATVPIYYEPRLAKIELPGEDIDWLDVEFEEITEQEEDEARESLKSKWARAEAIVGNPKRLKRVAQDIVEHFEERLTALDGKGMIVCMSRRICVELYNEIVALRPEWHSDDDQQGFIKVIMSGSAADRAELQPHIRTKQERKALANLFKDAQSGFKLVIVRDMWLTGFDCPSLTTMYVDKWMVGHNLMQAIARVNRVFEDKPAGLVVDYLGLAEELKKALKHYTGEDRAVTAVDLDVAFAVLEEKIEVVRAMYHGFDYGRFFTGTPEERLGLITTAMDFILGLDEGKKRYSKAVSDLSKAFALAVPHEGALALRDEVSFFQAVKANIVKNTGGGRAYAERLDLAVRQLISKAIASNDVIDIYREAGLDKPNISILSDEWLEEVRRLPYRNLALETLRKLLNDEIKDRFRKNVVLARKFSEMLEQSILAYQNRALTAAEVIQELIELAKEMRAAHQRGDELGLNEDELAFYDALGTNDSAVQALGDATLTAITHELVDKVRASATIDWTAKESVKAALRVRVRQILSKHGYPPDKQEQAVLLVLEQAERVAADWAA